MRSVGGYVVILAAVVVVVILAVLFIAPGKEGEALRKAEQAGKAAAGYGEGISFEVLDKAEAEGYINYLLGVCEGREKLDKKKLGEITRRANAWIAASVGEEAKVAALLRRAAGALRDWQLYRDRRKVNIAKVELLHARDILQGKTKGREGYTGPEPALKKIEQDHIDQFRNLDEQLKGK